VKHLLVGFVLCISLHGAEPEAIAISRNIVARHLPFGTILDPIFDAPDSDQIVAYTRCGDSAIWTGHWLAAESYRYAVTKSPEALANVKTALNGIQTLMDVSGNDVLARCIVPSDSAYADSIIHEESSNRIYSGSLWGYPFLWVGNTSRDQYSGVFYGLTVANDVVNDASVRDMVSYLATRALNYLRSHAWVVEAPDGYISTLFLGRMDQQLSFLKLGRRINPGKFETDYKAESILLAPETLAPIGLEVQDAHGSYYKFNLDTINFYGLLSSGDNFIVRLSYKGAYDILRKTTDDHGNAFFNMVDRAINGANSKRDADTVQMLDQWLQRPRRDFYVDLRDKYPSCGPIDQACQPIPVAERVNSDFLWQRSPFLLYGGGNGLVETAGIDYILPYWMARYYGVINP
jgi:hypothetical protein